MSERVQLKHAKALREAIRNRRRALWAYFGFLAIGLGFLGMLVIAIDEGWGVLSVVGAAGVGYSRQFHAGDTRLRTAEATATS